jgi:MFS family permease
VSDGRADASARGRLQRLLGSGWVRLQATAIAGSASQGLMLAALPLLTVSITTDPRQVSLVTAVGQSPWLLFSLFAGALIDRVRRTSVLVLCYAIQFGAGAMLVLAGSAHWLSLPLLMAVAFLVTASQVLGDGASGALVPELVPAARLAAANTRLMVIDRGVVQFVVPPITGVLLGVGAAAPAWLACAAAVCAVAVARSVPSAGVTARSERAWRGIAEGLRYLVASPLLRSITVTVALGSFAASAATAMLVLYAKQVLHLGPVGYGGLLACLAFGWVASSFFVQRVIDRLGYAWSMRLAQVSTALTPLVIEVGPPWAPLTGGVLAVFTATTLIWNVCSQSVRQRYTPTPLLGRVLTSHRALAWGLMPLGSLAGGFVAAHWSLRGVFFVVTVLQALGALIVWWTVTPAAFARADTEAAATGPALSRSAKRRSSRTA